MYKNYKFYNTIFINNSKITGTTDIIMSKQAKPQAGNQANVANNRKKILNN